MTKDTDLAYCAGILDGEGNIGISKKQKVYFQLHIDITNIDYAVLDFIKDILGVGTIRYHGRGAFNKQPIYRYSAYSKRAYLVLSVLLPYIHIKKAQALLGIEFQSKIIGKHQSLEKKIIYERRMKRLNHIWRLI